MRRRCRHRLLAIATVTLALALGGSTAAWADEADHPHESATTGEVDGSTSEVAVPAADDMEGMEGMDHGQDGTGDSGDMEGMEGMDHGSGEADGVEHGVGNATDTALHEHDAVAPGGSRGRVAVLSTFGALNLLVLIAAALWRRHDRLHPRHLRRSPAAA